MGTLAIRINKEDISLKYIRKEFPGDPRPFVLLNTANAIFRFETEKKIIWAESRDFLEQQTTAGFSQQKKEWTAQYNIENCKQHFFIDEMEVPKKEFMDAVSGKPYMHPYQIMMEEYVLYDKKHDFFLQEENGKWSVRNFFNATRYRHIEDAVNASKKAEETGKFHDLSILEIKETIQTTKVLER